MILSHNYFGQINSKIDSYNANLRHTLIRKGSLVYIAAIANLDL